MKLISTLTDRIKLESSAKSWHKKGCMIMSLLAFSLCLSPAERATAAAACKNVEIKLQNATPDTIKVTKFEYFDFDSNVPRIKNILEPSGEKILQSGTVHSANADLGQIGNKPTKFRVTYQHRQGPNTFADPVEVITDRFVCIDTSTHRVKLDK